MDDKGQQALARVRQGEFVTVDLVRPRNPRHNNLYWALMKIVCDNSEKFHSAEQVSDAMKIALGHTEMVWERDGKMFIKLKSISFANMDQTEFDVFFSGCVDIILTKFLPNVTDEVLRREVEEMCGAVIG